MYMNIHIYTYLLSVYLHIRMFTTVIMWMSYLSSKIFSSHLRIRLMLEMRSRERWKGHLSVLLSGDQVIVCMYSAFCCAVNVCTQLCFLMVTVYSTYVPCSLNIITIVCYMCVHMFMCSCTCVLNLYRICMQYIHESVHVQNIYMHIPGFHPHWSGVVGANHHKL